MFFYNILNPHCEWLKSPLTVERLQWFMLLYNTLKPHCEWLKITSNGTTPTMQLSWKSLLVGTAKLSTYKNIHVERVNWKTGI